METIKRIFNNYKSVTDEKTGKNGEQITNILEQFDTSNTEGVDPINVRVFETVHPHPLTDYRHHDIIKVPRALGYLIEIDPRTRMNQSCSLQIKSNDYSQFLNDDFGTLFDFQGRAGGSVRGGSFFVYGPAVAVDCSVVGGRQRHRHEHEEANPMLTRWGVRLTVKPLLGTPSYRSKPSLSNAILKPIVHRINGDLYSWFQMLNLMTFLSSAMAR